MSRVPTPARDAAQCGRRHRRFADAEPPELVADIQLLHGPDGEHLVRQQVRVLWEVTEWLAHHNSPSGQQRAA